MATLLLYTTISVFVVGKPGCLNVVINIFRFWFVRNALFKRSVNITINNAFTLKKQE